MIKALPEAAVYYFDESRFGTHSKLGHGWFARGLRSEVRVKLGFENFYLYSAVNPRSGEEFSLIAPYVNVDCMNIFLEQFGKSIGNMKAVIIMDCAGWHKSKRVKLPENISIIYLPPYSPELNPVERLWRYIKQNTIRNQIYESLEALESTVASFLLQLNRCDIVRLCQVNYLDNL